MNQPEARTLAAFDCLSGAGEVRALMRSINWSRTPIGAVDSWSPALRTMVSFLLANPFQMLLWWGPGFLQLYNDALVPSLGAKHPKSMGQRASECWAEIWHIIRPLIETPFRGGEATWLEDILLEIQRHDFVEETHWTMVHSPVADETAPKGIGGVAGIVREITEKVVTERRKELLRDLAARSAQAQTVNEACRVAAETLAGYPKDIPFALFYLMENDRRRAGLAGSAGLDADPSNCPLAVDLANTESNGQPWPFSYALSSEAMQVVEDLQKGEWKVPPGPWSDPPRSAVILPIPSHIEHQFDGFLILGISSRLRCDDAYRRFCELVTGQVATAIANARAYEEEKRHAKALMEIDRATTAFFGDVSHEFRTPPTLVPDPLEETASAADEPVVVNRRELELVHRNLIASRQSLQQTLEALQQSDERWRAVFDNSAAGIAVHDVSGRFQMVNAAFKRMLGYSENELCSATLIEITHEEDREVSRTLLAELADGRRQHFRIEKRFRRKDGGYIWANVDVSLLSNLRGSPPLVMAVTEDITPRRRAQEKLHEGERRFQMLLESIPQHVWSLRADGTVSYWNQRLLDYTGLTTHEVQEGWWNALHPNDNERAREAWQQAWSEGTPYELEQRIRGRDGLYRRFLTRAVPVHNELGQVVEWFGTDTDIEDRRRAEERLQNAQSELAHITRLTTLGELSASIAHELNQPLTAIAMDGNACLRWLSKPEPNLEEARAPVKRMINEGQRASQVIGKLHALMNNSPPEMLALDVNALISDVLILTRHQLHKHGILLRTDLSPDLLSTRGDPIQLQQVMVNLIMNAIEATRAVDQESRDVLVASQNHGPDEIVVLVRDSGVGLDPGSVDEIFKPFVTSKPGGMGMGLSISASIVKAHGGRLWATANADRGATFQFSLPARSGEVLNSRNPPPGLEEPEAKMNEPRAMAATNAILPSNAPTGTTAAKSQTGFASSGA
jgi:PAS domain S-box-containing protein